MSFICFWWLPCNTKYIRTIYNIYQFPQVKSDRRQAPCPFPCPTVSQWDRMSLGSQEVKILPQPNRSPFKHGSIIGKWSSLKFYLHPKKMAALWPKMRVILFHDLTNTGFCLFDFFVPWLGHFGHWGPLHRPFRFTSGRSFTSGSTFPCSTALECNVRHGFVQKLSENKIVNHHFPIDISQNNNFAWFPIFRQTPYSSILDILA